MIYEESTMKDTIPLDDFVDREDHFQGEVELQNGISLRSIIAMTCALGGVQVIWSTIFSNGTIYLGALGLPDALTALVWSIPAICGCFIQPIVGASSDTCVHPWGRRKPYIAVGTAGVTASILSLAWADRIGHWIANLLSSPSHDDAARMIALICAGTSICMLSLMLQPLQCGLRALILDLCPAGQQIKAQCWAARCTGIGQMIGCAAGLTSPLDTGNLGVVYTFRVLAITAVLSVNSTVAVTLFGVHEPIWHPINQQQTQQSSLRAILRSLLRTLNGCPSSMLRVFSIQFLSWMGWFAFLFYHTSYVNTVYMTTTAAPDDKLSGFLASLMSLAFSCVSFMASAILPTFVKRYQCLMSLNKISRTSRRLRNLALVILWSFTLGLSALLMFLTLISTSFDVTIVLMAANGIPWAVTAWVPFALVGELTAAKPKAIDHEDDGSPSEDVSHSSGSIIGLHNIAISAPQILAAGISSVILWSAQMAGTRYGTGWVLRAGGLAHLGAASLAYTLRA